MTPSRTRIPSKLPRGFSLLETMLVVALLFVVLAVATDGLIQMQKRHNADAGKVDMTQLARQFMDQIINDLHQTGYPGAKLYDPASTPSANNIAAGLLSVDANAIEFEGDVDGSGNVSHVWLQLLWANGTPVTSGPGSCPCTLQRGTLYKTQVGTAAVPYYTEVNNVTNTNIFSAYLFDGSQVSLPAGATDLPNIKDIKITIDLRSTTPEADGVTFPTITMASEAKINN
jgi:type II secretory pathway pseudopilin PulG